MDLKEKTRLLFLECDEVRRQDEAESPTPPQPKKLTVDDVPKTLLNGVRELVAMKRQCVQIPEGIGYWWWTPLPDQTCGFGGCNRPAIIADELCWESKELAETICDDETRAYNLYNVVRSEWLSKLLGGPLWPGGSIRALSLLSDPVWDYLKEWVNDPIVGKSGTVTDEAEILLQTTNVIHDKNQPLLNRFTALKNLQKMCSFTMQELLRSLKEKLGVTDELVRLCEAAVQDVSGDPQAAAA